MTEDVQPNPYAPTQSVTADVKPPDNTPEPPKWYIDDNTPGVGQRPDWLPEKYQKVSDLGKAYTEAQKKLGSFTGAPEKYDLSVLELDENQLLVKEMTSVAKELNMSQDGFNKFLGRIASATATEDEMHLDQQVKALGKDGERMLVEYKNWSKDYLKPEVREVVSEWIKTADDLKAFNHLMAHTHMSAVPTNNTMALANKFEGVSELKAELTKNINRYKTDKSYQKDWSARMKRAFERNPNS
jgi:hypothetical protein